MPTASAAEPAQQRGAETPAESVGCWWKTHLAQTCRSLVALKNAAEDGRAPYHINRASGRLDFLTRHASNTDGNQQFPRLWRALTQAANTETIWKARTHTARITCHPGAPPFHRSELKARERPCLPCWSHSTTYPR